MIPLLTSSVVSVLCMFATDTIFSKYRIGMGETCEEGAVVRKNMSATSAMEEIKDMDMEQLVSLLVERIERRSPELVKAIQGIDKDAAISETLHLTYLEQIASAQAYLNENHQADLSRVQCLLRKMLPDTYHKAISDLREDQAPSVIYNIFGGVHQHAPNARKAEQKKYLR